MRLECLASRVQDTDQLTDGSLKVVVHNHVIKLFPMRHVPDGIPEPSGDDLFGVRAAVSQALLQGGLRRWQNEYCYALGQRLTYLLRALPVDFKDDVVPTR